MSSSFPPSFVWELAILSSPDFGIRHAGVSGYGWCALRVAVGWVWASPDH